MTKPDIRTMALDAYDDILALWERAGLSHRPEGRDAKETVKKEMGRGLAVFLGAFEGSRLIGSILATEDGRRGWINRLAVDPRWRRRGVAKRLIEEAETVLRDRGMKIIAVLIEEENEHSVELFRACGYVLDRSILYLSKREGNWV
ncbi:MAG: GNAT family N-acetyltransferase [Planctomycetota bacterium]|jgi:ribosomal protein S18 acetylase RimI-like enzyme